DEDVSRGSDVIVPDRKRIGRLAPLRLREDQRGRVLPVPQHRPQRREQRLVHRVADQQRVHVGASRDVGPAGRRAVEQERHEPATEGGVQSRRKNVRRDRLGHRQKLPPAPPPLKPPPPPKPPNPPPKPPPPPPPPPPRPPPPQPPQPPPVHHQGHPLRRWRARAARVATSNTSRATKKMSLIVCRPS